MFCVIIKKLVLFKNSVCRRTCKKGRTLIMLDYNNFFLECEAEMAQKAMEMRAVLEQKVDEVITSQFNVVCEFMRPRLIACWENGSLGEEVVGEFTFDLPEAPLSKTYAKVLTEIVREKLFAHGFLVSFNPQKKESPEVARVYFNFTNDFYSTRKDWCSSLAQEYVDEKVVTLCNTLQHVAYLHSLYCSQGMGSPFGNEVVTIVKLPPAAREMIAQRVCEEMSTKITNYILKDRDKIIFGLK